MHYHVGIKHFGKMISTTVKLLQAKLPCDFGGWKDYANFLAKL
jgi:hypothetical protein